MRENVLPPIDFNPKNWPKRTEHKKTTDGLDVIEIPDDESGEGMDLGQLAKEEVSADSKEARRVDFSKSMEKSPNIDRNVSSSLFEEGDREIRKELTRYNKYYLKAEKDSKGFREAREAKRGAGSATLEELAEAKHQASKKKGVVKRDQKDIDDGAEISF